MTTTEITVTIAEYTDMLPAANEFVSNHPGYVFSGSSCLQNKDGTMEATLRFYSLDM